MPIAPEVAETLVIVHQEWSVQNDSLLPKEDFNLYGKNICAYKKVMLTERGQSW